MSSDSSVLRWAVYSCQPLRDGWVHEWVINGHRIDQPVPVRFRSNQPLEVRIKLVPMLPTPRVTAVVELDNDYANRRQLLAMGLIR